MTCCNCSTHDDSLRMMTVVFVKDSPSHKKHMTRVRSGYFCLECREEMERVGDIESLTIYPLMRWA